jgi:hypothetical protein
MQTGKRPSKASPWRPRGFGSSNTQQGGNLDFPALVPPACPPEERAAAVAALDEMHRRRPLKPPTRIALGIVLVASLFSAHARCETEEQVAQRYRRQNAEACQSLAFAHVAATFGKDGVCRVVRRP